MVRVLKHTDWEDKGQPKTKDRLIIEQETKGQAVKQQHYLMTHGPGSLKVTKGISKMSTWSPRKKNPGNMMMTPNLVSFVLLFHRKYS